MATTIKFKALESTRVRDKNGVKIKVGKDKTFITNENYAKIYRGYKRLFEELEVIVTNKPKLDKTKANNDKSFKVTISENMKNTEIEKLLTEMGAKFTKKSSRVKLIEAFEKRSAELDEEKITAIIEKQTQAFKENIDNRTLDQLEKLVEDLEEATNIENIDKEVCKSYILEVYEAKKQEAEKKVELDDDGNSEGALEGADAGEVK